MEVDNLIKDVARYLVDEGLVDYHWEEDTEDYSNATGGTTRTYPVVEIENMPEIFTNENVQHDLEADVRAYIQEDDQEPAAQGIPGFGNPIAEFPSIRKGGKIMSELKFKLTDKTKINALGVKLFQIEATVDIEAHNVKKGDKGGWVQSERLSSGEPRISGDAWVAGDAQVFGKAQVYGNANVLGNTQVCGDAQVFGDAWVYGDARVFENAQVYGDAQVFGDAEVFGKARVFENAQVAGDAWVYGDARVFENAQVYGDAQVFGKAQVYGNAVLSAKRGYQKGRFIGGDDSDNPTFAEITDKTGSSHWKHQYVIGDYKIDDLDDPDVSEMTIADIEKLVGHKVKIINKEGK